jgi:hypothetical protein
MPRFTSKLSTSFVLHTSTIWTSLPVLLNTPPQLSEVKLPVKISWHYPHRCQINSHFGAAGTYILRPERCIYIIFHNIIQILPQTGGGRHVWPSPWRSRKCWLAKMSTLDSLIHLTSLGRIKDISPEKRPSPNSILWHHVVMIRIHPC